MFDSSSRESGSSATAGRIPVDLILVALVTLGTVAVALTPALSGSPLQVALGLVFVFLAPGYAFVSLLFPERAAPPDAGLEAVRARTGDDTTVSGTERAVLALGLSVVIVPLVGLVMNFTSWGIAPTPILVSLAAVTLVLTVGAAVRRLRRPADRRFGVDVLGWLARGRNWIRQPPSRTESALNLVLVVGLVLATSGIVYAVAMPKPGERFSEFYLLTEDEETGELVADGYPTELTRGEQATLVVGVTNQEHRTTEYTVVVELQRLRPDGTVVEVSQLHQFSTTLEHNESWQQRHTVDSTIVGERLRLAYLLYRGAPPSDPTFDNAYRSVHVWVNGSATTAGTNQIRPPGSPASVAPGSPARLR